MAVVARFTFPFTGRRHRCRHRRIRLRHSRHRPASRPAPPFPPVACAWTVIRLDGEIAVDGPMSSQLYALPPIPPVPVDRCRRYRLPRKNSRCSVPSVTLTGVELEIGAPVIAALGTVSIVAVSVATAARAAVDPVTANAARRIRKDVNVASGECHAGIGRNYNRPRTKRHSRHNRRRQRPRCQQDYRRRCHQGPTPRA